MNSIFIVKAVFLLITCAATLEISAKENPEENTNSTNDKFLPYTLKSKGIKESRKDNYQHFLILNKEDERNVPVEKLDFEHGVNPNSYDNHHDWKRLSTFISPYSTHKQAAIGNTDYVWNNFGNIPQITHGPPNGFLVPTILYYIHLGILSYVLFGIGALLNRLLTLGDLLKPPLPFTSTGGGGFYKSNI